MTITFNTPVTVGPLGNQVTIASMQLKSFSLNLAPPSGGSNALLSITLTDPVSGYDHNIVYEDSTTTPAFVSQILALQAGGVPWINKLYQRIMADGKIPPGTIS